MITAYTVSATKVITSLLSHLIKARWIHNFCNLISNLIWKLEESESNMDMYPNTITIENDTYSESTDSVGMTNTTSAIFICLRYKFRWIKVILNSQLFDY